MKNSTRGGIEAKRRKVREGGGEEDSETVCTTLEPPEALKSGVHRVEGVWNKIRSR